MALSTIQNNSFADTAVHGYRNLIINGAMQVAQRGTSFTAPANNSYTLDRFPIYTTSTFLNVAQDSDAPDGFRNSLKTTVNTANPTPSSTEICRIGYVVEAQDVARLNYGSASAQTTTLSFWTKSTVAADYTIFIYASDPARSIVKGYTINSSNTWEYKSITIDGDSGGTGINDDNGIGLYLEFNLMAGSTYNTAGYQDNWVNGGGVRASGQTANCTTSGATWQITGLQLEVGSEATPFEHRPYADELRRCQRYFYSSYNTGDAIGSTSNGTGAISLRNGSPDNSIFTVNLPTELRVSGTLTIYNTITGVSGQIRNRNKNTNITAYNLQSGTKNVTFYGGSSSDENDWMDAHITVDAEL